MNEARINRPWQAGFTLIEVLVALLIIVLGLLGLAGMQVRIQQAEFESYQRTQALILLYDLVDRINVHRATARCFEAAATPYLGTGAANPPSPLCTASAYGNNNTERQRTDEAISEWNDSLLGAAELKGGLSVGAMIGARGCVSYDGATELLGATGAVLQGTGIYTVAVAWQGTVDTFEPTVTCAKTDPSLYGTETRRRVVSTTFRIASLP